MAVLGNEFKTKEFVFKYEDSGDQVVFKVFPRATKETEKMGIAINLNEEVAIFKFTKPDENQITNLTIELLRTFSDKELTTIYEHILDKFNSFVEENAAVFYRVPASYMAKDGALKNLLINRKYVQDSSNPEFYEAERPIAPMTILFMSVGLCLGIGIGAFFFDNMVLGMPFGLAIGLMFGSIMDHSSRQKRDELKKKRGNAFTETTEEE